MPEMEILSTVELSHPWLAVRDDLTVDKALHVSIVPIIQILSLSQPRLGSDQSRPTGY